MAAQYPTQAPPIQWTYANQAARLAATGFIAGDIGKFALQLSDATVWRLTGYSPITWSQEPNGPLINKFRDLKPEWPGLLIKPMKDGGANYNNPNPTPILRWELTYKKVSPAGSDSLAMIDAHFLDAQSFFEGFSFRHPKTLVLYNDVHYEVFDDPDHSNRVTQQVRKLTLIKRPY